MTDQSSAVGPVGAVQVGLADIARLARVRPTAVSNWRRRHEHFPQPVGGTDRSPRFLLSEVEAFLRTQGRNRDLTPPERARRALEVARVSADPVEVLTATGLALAALAGGPSEQLRHGRLFDGWRPPSPGVVDPVLAALGEGVDDGETYDALCRALLGSLGRPGVSATPPVIAEALAELAGPGDGAVLDPVCGAGSVLLAAAAKGRRPLLGQEIDASLARLTVARLAAAGILADVVAGDSLHCPRTLPVLPAVVLCHPPFAERSWGQETLADDPRFVYGRPPGGEPELAWVQAALAAARPGGTAVVMMPPAAAARPSGRRIRRALLEHGVLACVISLPPGLGAHYALALQVWVLRRPENGAAPVVRDVLMVDLSGLDVPAGADDAEDAVRERAIRARLTEVADVLHRPGQACGAQDSLGPLARRVAVSALLEGDDVDITPRRHLPAGPVEVPATEEFLARCTALSDRWVALGHAVGRLREPLESLLDAAPAGSRGSGVGEATIDVGEATIDELISSGHVANRRRGSRSVEPAATTSALVLTCGDLALRRPPSESDDVDADELRNPPIRSGDVLVPSIFTTLRARVAAGEDVGAYPGPGVIVLRPDPAVVDPHYLAGYLSSVSGGHQAARLASTSGGSSRVDPRRLRVPLPPIEVQRRWGALFETVASLQREEQAAGAEGESVLQSVVDVLALRLPGGTSPTPGGTSSTSG